MIDYDELEGDEAHKVYPPIEEAEELPYDHSKKGPGRLTIEVTFDRPEINRLKAGFPRGPLGVTGFIKNAALAEADRLAAEREREELPQTD
ncbi:MAG: hypothetical protein OXH38_03985 [Chloroflexi bacterium]|nr:hypothetical protein [Chloroflexota bacterium]